MYAEEFNLAGIPSSTDAASVTVRTISLKENAAFAETSRLDLNPRKLAVDALDHDIISSEIPVRD